METLYTAAATSTGGGRDGHVRSTDGFIDLGVAPPKEIGGRGGATNPEQLFAAGFAACFHSALQAVARQRKLELGSSSVTAAVDLGREGEGFGLAVTLEADLPDVDEGTAAELLDTAHAVCPYSNATRGNIEVTVRRATS
jgi:lipoyl-dependent peroxiredoxin